MKFLASNLFKTIDKVHDALDVINLRKIEQALNLPDIKAKLILRKYEDEIKLIYKFRDFQGLKLNSKYKKIISDAYDVISE